MSSSGSSCFLALVPVPVPPPFGSTRKAEQHSSMNRAETKPWSFIYLCMTLAIMRFPYLPWMAVLSVADATFIPLVQPNANAMRIRGKQKK